MISRIGVRLRWLRRKLSRTHWAAVLAGVPLPKGEASGPGIIMIQIDGLARQHLERAVEHGSMRFLRRSLAKERFHLGSFYSGVPSTTPAVQGEIFYGVKAAVPAFQFLRRVDEKIFRMYDPEASAAIEKDLEAANPAPLIKEGHAYSNIYRAGAAKTWYCAQDLGGATILRRLRPLKWLFLSIVYSVKILRMATLALIELVLAVIDCFRGLFEKEDLGRELLFVPVRVGICILLREFIRFRVLLDIERGIRVVHANFLGYDEQAHRRGPGSDFAYWTLKGIDRAIRDLYRASLRSDYRDYEFLIYSDHGQEHSIPYPKANGRTIDEGLHEAFAGTPLAGYEVWSPGRPKLVGSTLDRWRGSPAGADAPPPSHSPEAEKRIIVTAMGPVGHLYLPVPLDDAAKHECAARMIDKAGVPLVLFRSSDGGTVHAVNARGPWQLPVDAAEILGGDHPFLPAAAADLTELCHHRDAGDLIISGWDRENPPLSFPLENGAHGGPGRQETHGFTLLSERFHHPEKPYLRGGDLYEMVSDFLAGTTRWKPHAPDPAIEGTPSSLRILTYNIHSCRGIDGKIRPERIARVINRLKPDVIALQEVDAHRLRSGHHDQAQLIADHFEMQHAFYSVLEEQKEKYGIAIFSRYPFEVMKSDLLTQADPRKMQEARGALWVKIRGVHVINTHLGLGRDERNRQIQELLGPSWLGAIPQDEPVVVCGDFNSTSRSVVWKKMTHGYRDAQLAVPGHSPQRTFATIRPFARLDHIFVSPQMKVTRIEISRTPTALVASDHFPLLAEIELPHR